MCGWFWLSIGSGREGFLDRGYYWFSDKDIVFCPDLVNSGSQADV
jgi:hypothetical protein